MANCFSLGWVALLRQVSVLAEIYFAFGVGQFGPGPAYSSWEVDLEPRVVAWIVQLDFLVVSKSDC